MNITVSAAHVAQAVAVAIGILGILSATAAQEPGPVMMAVPRTAVSPKIDGVLDDAAWKGAAVFADFRRADGKVPVGKARLLLAQDDRALYVAVEMFEDAKTLQSLVADVKEHDGKDMWEDDEVELFLAPGGAAKGYYQIAVNSRGVSWDAYHAIPGDSDTSWDPKYECAAKVGEASWVVELALPWAAFDSTLKFADAWGFEALIMRQSIREELWLAPIKGKPHQPDKFATLTGIVGQAPANAKERAPIVRIPPDPTKEPFFHFYEAREFKCADGKVLLYRLVRPTLKNPGDRPPILIYLHGSGLRGENNIDPVPEFHEVTLAAAQEWGAVAIVPQCPRTSAWAYDPPDPNRPPRPRPEGEPEPPPLSPVALLQSVTPLRAIMELLPEIEKEFNADPDRVYLTGGSMGGGGVYELLANRPEAFAAAVILCGARTRTDKAAQLAKLPMWIFQGDKDRTVPPERAREMVAALKAAGGTPRYTEYKGLGHGIGGAAAAEKDLLPWIFSQKRQAKP